MSDYQTRNTDTGAGAGTPGTTGTEGTGTSGIIGEGTMGRLQEKADQAREMLNDRVSQVSDSMSRMGQQVSDTMRTGMDRIRNMDSNDLNVLYDDMLESARRNPGRTILISAGVGMVLGMFLRGSNRNNF